MKITVDTITSTPSGLVLGCVIHGPGGAWIRFALADIPYGKISSADLLRGLAYKAYDCGVDDRDDVLPLDWGYSAPSSPEDR